MDTVFRVVVLLTMTTKVMSFNFEGFMKSLPMPADLRAMIIDMHEKEQEFRVPDKDDINLVEFKTAPHFVASKNYLIKPTSTVLAKDVTESIKPVTLMRRLLRTSVTLNPGPSNLDISSTTAKAPFKPLTLPPPFHQLPHMSPQMSMHMPLAMPIFASVPMMLPMRAYFEKVHHDHPPLYKIKRMIKEDEKRWKEEKGSDSEVSVEVAYSDVSLDRSEGTDTDSDISENEVGSDDCDTSINNSQ